MKSMHVYRLLPFRTFQFHRARFRGSKKSWILTAFGLTLSILVLLFVFRYGLWCTGWQASAAVNALCRLYKAGKVAGNLCQNLCITGTVVLGNCHTYHLSKDVVVAAKWQGQPVVLKTRHASILEYDRLSIDEDVSHYPSTSEFAYMVKTKLRYDFNISLGHQMQNDNALLTYLWTSDFANIITSSQAYMAAVDSIWSLVQQNEYMLFKYFEKYNVFPRVLGTCGHIYAVEYIETQAYNINNWASKLSYALEVLKLATALQTAFHQPLYMCDVKPEHFGRAANSDVKVLDADTMFFQSVINKIVQNGEPCSAHEQCAFWDCKSKCHPKEKVCNHNILNNNLQMICEHLFLRSTESQWKWISQPGLLRTTNAQNIKILNSLLSECANPSEETDLHVRTEASNTVLDRLRLFLRNELSNHNRETYLNNFLRKH